MLEIGCLRPGSPEIETHLDVLNFTYAPQNGYFSVQVAPSLASRFETSARASRNRGANAGSERPSGASMRIWIQRLRVIRTRSSKTVLPTR